MQIESLCRDAVELLQSSFGKRPETFYAVDVNIADSKDINRVIDSQMFRVTNINQTVITAPGVGMNDRIKRNTPANNRLQRLFLHIRDNFGIDA